MLWLFLCLVQEPNIEGTWSGYLHIPNGKLRLVLHLKLADGAWKASLDSPDQSVSGLECSDISFVDNTLSLSVPTVKGTFTGKLKDEKIEGTWSQGMPLPLTLQRGELEGPKRPQTPKEPFSYEIEEVSFKNDKAKITLAGTLTKPKGNGPFPAAVLLSGTGPQDRDETIAGHKPFWVLADYLTRQGIAVLRFDDRGVGNSEGNYGLASTFDFGEDAAAGAAFLATRREINPKKIGLIGHSEGGTVGPKTVLGSKDFSFLVTLAGPTVSGRDIMIEQTKLILKASGLDGETLDNISEINNHLYDLGLKHEDRQELEKALSAYLAEKREKLGPYQSQILGLGEERVPGLVPFLGSNWFKSFVDYNPGDDLKKLKIPILALYGEKDLQVPPAQSLPPLKQLASHAEVENFAGLNHLFQPAKTGLPAEYAQIETTMDEKVMERISTWILALPKK